MSKQTALEEIVHHQIVNCPHCRKEVVIAWNKAVALTWEEFQRKVRMEVKKLG